MKRLLSIILAVLLCLPLAACGADEAPPTSRTVPSAPVQQESTAPELTQDTMKELQLVEDVESDQAQAPKEEVTQEPVVLAETEPTPQEPVAEKPETQDAPARSVPIAEEAPASAPVAPTPEPEKQSPTVYITKTGKRYHYDSSCNGGTYIESTLDAALKKGLTPCQKCVQ